MDRILSVDSSNALGLDRREALFVAPIASSTELSEILESSRVSPPARVGFKEERHNPMFEDALFVEGHLEYLGHGALRKVIESPFQETFSIEEGEISITRDGEILRLPARRSKSVQALLGAFEALLAGDADRLESVFDYEILGEAAAWTINLQPKSRRIRKQLSKLRVYGNSTGVSKIRIELGEGEWHVIHIRDQVPSSERD